MRCFFFIGILFPILLAVKIKDINQYNKIKAGNGKEDFFNLMMNCKSLQELFKELTHLKKIDKTIIDELYQYIFISKEDDGYVINSSFSIRRSFVNRMNELLSYLGEKVTL